MRAFLSFLMALILPTTALPVYQNDPGRQIYCCAPNSEKRIALTFDDGPHPTYTHEILSILREYGVKATFFVIGENVNYYPNAFAAIANDGHEIGNHTFSHPHLQNKNAAALQDEIAQTERALLTRGYDGKRLFRPPEGVCSNDVCKCAKDAGYSIILWTVDTRDWDHTPADTIVKAVKETVKSGDIVLFHDYIASPSPTPNALRQLIPALLEMGYQFVTVSELIGI